MQKMTFARVGGLSSVNYKPSREKGSRYHCPPARKGIYAFIWPYIDPFLYAWKISKIIEKRGDKPLPEKEYEAEYDRLYRAIGYRKFSYAGPLWTHIGPVTTGSWYHTDTDELPELIRKDHHRLIRSLTEDAHRNKWNWHINKVTTDPLKSGRGLGITFTRDHMEVFIEKKHLGKVG
jgi:hypothetical protein